MNNKEIYNRAHLVCLTFGVGCIIGGIILSFLNIVWLLFISIGIIGFGYYLLSQSPNTNSIFTDEFINSQLHPWKIKDE